MSLAHELPAWNFADREAWKNEDKMNLIIQFFHTQKMSISDFFGLSEKDWKNCFLLNNRQLTELQKAKSSLANYAFLAETLQNNGIDAIPIVSPDYSKTLKENLKKSAPILLYTKGNQQIMQEKSIAIVGSREASDIALQFTDNVAKKATKEWKVVVSGFAKGVDKQALDSSIACKGQSIIVLPQGILTFEAGFKTYYKQIIDDDVLVLSTFHPQAPWGKDLAMARNSIIYGLAKEIFVAESKPSKNRQGKETKGGTYAGAMDGLKKGRQIYVRNPDPTEKNDNLYLIQCGAIAVDFDGNQVSLAETAQATVSFSDQIKDILATKELTINEIHTKIKFPKSEATLKKELLKLDFVEVIKIKNKNYYSLKSTSAATLF
jgi:predicted Rossmann fold nucleotide-binding protein DprA/Smf involved in DNA uptake